MELVGGVEGVLLRGICSWCKNLHGDSGEALRLCGFDPVQSDHCRIIHVHEVVFVWGQSLNLAHVLVMLQLPTFTRSTQVWWPCIQDTFRGDFVGHFFGLLY